MTEVLLHLDERTYKLFQRLTKERNHTATEVIREIIEKYIEENL